MLVKSRLLANTHKHGCNTEQLRTRKHSLRIRDHCRSKKAGIAAAVGTIAKDSWVRVLYQSAL
jgi:hypothetical protein